MTVSDPTAVVTAAQVLDLTESELWEGYAALTGTLDIAHIRRFLAGERPLSDHEYDVLVQSINEHFLERGEDHPVPYANDLHER